jgi:hypothetical protein
MQVKRNRGLAHRRSAAARPPVRPPLTRKRTASPQGIAITLKYWTLRLPASEPSVMRAKKRMGEWPRNDTQVGSMSVRRSLKSLSTPIAANAAGNRRLQDRRAFRESIDRYDIAVPQSPCQLLSYVPDICGRASCRDGCVTCLVVAWNSGSPPPNGSLYLRRHFTYSLSQTPHNVGSGTGKK